MGECPEVGVPIIRGVVSLSLLCISLGWQLCCLNFANAIICTVASSWVLYCMEATDRLDIHAAKSSPLAGWTIEAVCGYILVESTLLLHAKRWLPRAEWYKVAASFGSMSVFHIVSLAGLLSALLTGSGYTIATWGIWTELTSVFLGVKDFMLYGRWEVFRPRSYQAVNIFAQVLFVLQRVCLFSYLVWLTFWQLSWHPVLVGQFVILLVGAVLNAKAAYEQII